jgi:hypothetical protein
VSIVTTLPAIPNEDRETHLAIGEFENRSGSYKEEMDNPAVNREVGSRTGAAWIGSRHHERQGQAIGLRGAVSAGQFARWDA